MHMLYVSASFPSDQLFALTETGARPRLLFAGLFPPGLNLLPILQSF